MSDFLGALDCAIGLHEHVEVIYVVDGYEAVLFVHDGSLEKLRAFGSTVYEALDNLDSLIEKGALTL
jgi:hypothetical protein